MKPLKYTWIIPIIVLLFIVGGCSSTPSTNEEISLTIAAAVSLTDALEEIKEGYEKEHAVNITFNLAGSGTLAQQIRQGAPIDLFISANQQWMDTLDDEEIILPHTRQDITGNKLVMIAHQDADLSYESFQDIARHDVDEIAVGNPESVPAGLYTKDTLTSLDIWDELHEQMIFAKDVRQVLTYVETGNADIGFIYESDALRSKDIRVLARAEEKDHDPITYPGAVVADTKHEKKAQAFLDYLLSDEAQDILATHGFTK